MWSKKICNSEFPMNYPHKYINVYHYFGQLLSTCHCIIIKE